MKEENIYNKIIRFNFNDKELKIDLQDLLWMKLSKEEDQYMMNLMKKDIEDSDLVVKINIYNKNNILINVMTLLI